MTHTFRHPKHYKEIRVERKKLQAASVKQQAIQIKKDFWAKPQAPEDTSSKPQAPSSKLQAASRKQQAP